MYLQKLAVLASNSQNFVQLKMSKFIFQNYIKLTVKVPKDI